MKRLEGGEIDCAILALPYPTEKLEFQLIGEEAFWVAMPQGDPLTKKNKISAAELPQERLLLLEEGHCLRDHVISACGGSQIKAQFQGSSLYTLIEMVAWGQGITFVPAMALESPLLKHANIELRAFDEPVPHRQMALVWRATSYQKNNMALLADKLVELMAS